jgi:probable HAF family extracellular repeat protein
MRRPKNQLMLLGTILFCLASNLSGNGASQPMGKVTGPPPNYAIIDLGTLGGDFSQAKAINASGEVVGLAHNPSNLYHAFLWRNGSMQDLGTLGGDTSGAFDINDANQVVGRAARKGDSDSNHAFLWQKGSMQDLGTLGGSYGDAFGINSGGQIVGSAGTVDNPWSHAFLWTNNMEDLGTLGGNGSGAWGINSAMQVVGSSSITGSSLYHAFLWQNGSMQDLGTLGGDDSEALAINSYGEAVGYAYTQGSVYHAFLWQGISMQDLGTLGTLGGEFSEALAINGREQIVGISSSGGAFIWQNSTMYNLNDYILPRTGWMLAAATGINNAGQICGWGTNPRGQTHAFVLNPLISVEAATYRVVDLGTLGGSSYAYGINSVGDVVGNCGGNRAFLYSNGSMIDLGSLGGDLASALSINDSKHIVGYSHTDVQGITPPHAFLYSNGSMVDLGTLGGSNSYAQRINNTGQITGYSMISGGEAGEIEWTQNGR